MLLALLLIATLSPSKQKNFLVPFPKVHDGLYHQIDRVEFVHAAATVLFVIIVQIWSD